MEPQGRTIASPLQTRTQSKTFRLGKTTLRVRAHVQAVGLNAETKNRPALSRRGDFSLDITFYRTRRLRRLNGLTGRAAELPAPFCFSAKTRIRLSSNVYQALPVVWLNPVKHRRARELSGRKRRNGRGLCSRGLFCRRKAQGEHRFCGACRERRWRWCSRSSRGCSGF